MRLLFAWIVSLAALAMAQAAGMTAHTPPIVVQRGELRVELIHIPAGAFFMGSDKVEQDTHAGAFGNTKPRYLDEHPRHAVDLKEYWIDKYEVTNAQYREYVATTKVEPPDYWLQNGYILRFRMESLPGIGLEKLRTLTSKVFKIDVDTGPMTPPQLLDAVRKKLLYMDQLPVAFVSWGQADAYCRWAGAHLPTEAQWERAARGPGGLEFPWGDTWQAGQANINQDNWEGGVAPVGSYAADKSPDGVMDMAGNVSEWTANWYQPYPGSDYHSKDFGQIFRVARGAGWSGGAGHSALQRFQRSAYRDNLPPAGRFDDVGVRCATEHLTSLPK